MGKSWADKFNRKLEEKELARQEAKKSFQIYQEAALKLFDLIEEKVKGIEAISTFRYMVGQAVTSPVPLKALKLKCLERYLDIIPEGINLDSSKGRIRLKHNSKGIPNFIYVHLIVDPNSSELYPDNLVWAYNDKGAETFGNLPFFDDEKLEHVIELIFLSE